MNRSLIDETKVNVNTNSAHKICALILFNDDILQKKKLYVCTVSNNKFTLLTICYVHMHTKNCVNQESERGETSHNEKRET
jgi:hypothetical protein